MTDLHERFRSEFDDMPVPDLWRRIADLAEAEPATTALQWSRALVAMTAVVIALVLIGGPLLLLTSTDRAGPIADTSMTAAEPRSLTEVDPPWGETVGAITLLADGGIVVIANDPGRVLWSPDRVEWFDANPDRRVTPWYPESGEGQFEERIIDSTGNGYVAVRSEANDGVWIAAPHTGRWHLFKSTNDEDGDAIERVLTLAANDTAVLVVTQATSTGLVLPTGPGAPAPIPYIREYNVWLIDTSDGTIHRQALPLPAMDWAENPIAVANWFNDQWFVAIHRQVWTETDADEGWATPTPVLTSPDGRSWSIADSNFPPDSATSISVGSAEMIATECNFGGDSFWYSEDGINWEVTATDFMGHRSVYVDGLGYLVYYGGSPTAFSADGREWQSPAAAGLALRSLDGTDDPIPVGGNTFVIDNQVVQWSINKPDDGGEGTG